MPEVPSSPLVSPPDAGALSRRWLLRGAAGAAVAAGAGVALWRAQSTANSGAEPIPGFWSQQWSTPDGSVVAMSQFRGRPLLLNFWASWCAPCVQELPLINQFYQARRAHGWQVLGVAVDSVAPVRAFLQRVPLDFPVVLAGMAGAELGRSLGNLAGGLPFSVVFSGDGVLQQRKLGRLSPDDLQAWSGLK